MIKGPSRCRLRTYGLLLTLGSAGNRGHYVPNRVRNVVDRVELKRYRWTESMLDVPFLLGALAANALAGPSLVALLGGLGRQEAAARNLLTRMRELRAVQVEQKGRVNVYRLAASSYARYQEVEGTRALPAWSGEFDAVLYTVPESARTLRDRVVHTARSAGYGLLRPGVFIAADERWERLRIDPAELTGDAWLHHATITPANLDDARSMAFRAWNLNELGAAYDRALERCVAATGPVEVGWPALRRWRDIYATCFDAQLKDPNLPGELLPPDWPRARFDHAQAAMNRQIGRALQPFLRTYADGFDDRGLNEYYRSPWA